MLPISKRSITFNYMLFRILVSIYIFTLAALVPILGSLAFVGTSSKDTNSSFTKDIYTFKFDFRNVSFSRFIGPNKYFWNITNHLTLEESGLSQIYTFGLRSYCKGDVVDGVYIQTYCSGTQKLGDSTIDELNPYTIFYQDLQNAENSPLNENRTYELEFPLRARYFGNAYYRRSLKVSAYGILVGIVLSGAALALFAIPMFYWKWRFFYIYAYVLSIGSLAVLLAGGGVATKLWADAKDAFRIGSGIYRIRGNWGNGIFWKLLWLAISIQVTLLFTILIIMCCADPDTYDVTQNEKNEKKHSNGSKKANKRAKRNNHSFNNEKSSWLFSKKNQSVQKSNNLIQYDV